MGTGPRCSQQEGTGLQTPKVGLRGGGGGGGTQVTAEHHRDVTVIPCLGGM